MEEDILEVVHESAKDLHDCGIMDDETMEEFDELCVPSKEVRQKLFIEQCKKEGLSHREILERASIFPFNEKSKVLKWPKL